MEQHEFCRRFNISGETFEKSGLEWNELEGIARHFSGLRPSFESVGKYLVDNLLKCRRVHSINYRIKDEDHLIEKIIRKTVTDPGRSITIENYRSEITDLIGIRVLHLFKEDWQAIHEFITGIWELAEPPTAYVRPGDPDGMIDFYRKNDCTVKEHKFGYRSVHYVIKSKPDRDTYLVEVQARTIFEEAWGEIDHVVRYPYQTDNEFLVRLSSILNRLAGNADELGSYMKYFKERIDSMELEHRKTVEEKNDLIEALRKKISSLEIDKAKKDEITSDLRELEQSRRITVSSEKDLQWLHTFMDSNFVKGLTSQLNKFMQSEYFTPIEITDSDMTILEKTQQELLELLRHPESMNNLLENVAPVRELLTGKNPAEDRTGSGSDGGCACEPEREEEAAVPSDSGVAGT